MTTKFDGPERRHSAGAEELGELGFTVDLDERDQLLIASVRGVIDFLSAGPLRDQLHTALKTSAPRLVLDLEGVTFVDSTGLALFVSVQRRARAAGGWLRLANPPPQLHRVLRTTNLYHHLEVYPSVASAATTA